MHLGHPTYGIPFKINFFFFRELSMFNFKVSLFILIIIIVGFDMNAMGDVLSKVLFNLFVLRDFFFLSIVVWFLPIK